MAKLPRPIPGLPVNMDKSSVLKSLRDAMRAPVTCEKAAEYCGVPTLLMQEVVKSAVRSKKVKHVGSKIEDGATRLILPMGRRSISTGATKTQSAGLRRCCLARLSRSCAPCGT